MSEKFHITILERLKAEKIGVSYSNLRQRILVYGWDKEKAINTPIKRAISREDYEKAEKNGISREALRRRVINSNWDINKAVDTPLRKKTQGYKKFMNMALKNGISKNTFKERVYKLNWNFEKAATEPVNIKYSSKIAGA